MILGGASSAIMDFKSQYSRPGDADELLDSGTSEFSVYVTPGHLSRQCLSTTNLHYWYGSGAAHGKTYRTSLNLDLENQLTFTAIDLLVSIDMVEGKIREAIKITDQPALRSLDELSSIVEQNLKSKAFIRKGSLVVPFDPYEIFPFAFGEFDVEIDLTEIKRTSSFSVLGEELFKRLKLKD